MHETQSQIRLAKRLGAKLTLLHVVPEPSALDPRDEVPTHTKGPDRRIRLGIVLGVLPAEINAIAVTPAGIEPLS